MLYLENPGYLLDGAGYPALDQVGNFNGGPYIWGNSGGDEVYRYPTSSAYTDYSVDYWIQTGRDYHLSQPFGYAPYTYPHPLRA